MKLPKEGDFITIQSYKHDGILSSQRAMVEDGLQESQQLSTFIKSTGSISSLWYEIMKYPIIVILPVHIIWTKKH